MWKKLNNCFNLCLYRYLDYIYTNAKTSFNFEVFKPKADDLGAIVRVATTEAHKLHQNVEQTHAYTRKEFNKLCTAPPGIWRKERLFLPFRIQDNTFHSNI